MLQKDVKAAILDFLSRLIRKIYTKLNKIQNKRTLFRICVLVLRENYITI